MIPHPPSGVQPWANQSRIPSGGRAGDSTGSLPLSSSANLPDKPSMAAAPPPNGQQTVIDLTGNDSILPESEHPSKRPKLDTNVSGPVGDGKTANRSAELRSAPASGTARPATVSGRGRPACSFQELVSETYSGGVSAGNSNPGSQAIKPASPPPFPIRPWKYAPPQQSGSGIAVLKDSTSEREVQTTPYRLEVPSIAPILKGDKVADFSPWTGNHPEDVLSEQTTKQGHYDRTQVSQNESNTARPSLYAQLKHRSGLQVLSSVFAAALEKRQAHSKVASASTFKPPPRVTLTDNKREAWLRDLANPSVPLRRLSRTIPHGIRGKVLLDQCLSKWIPIGRAVWLAKCVGANEIRAFRRKGTSGSLALGLEVKWVRDWTTTVQQFLEGVISSCGKGDWKMKMTYAVRLAARLFFENLLDQDCYLDWYLSSLENASLDTLPIWLLMLGIYWDHLVRFRKRGRRLVELLLEKLRQATTTEPKELLKPLVDRISLLVRRLSREQTSSVVLPRSWDRYHDVLSSCLHLDDPTENAIFQSLQIRNARVQQAKDYRKVAQRSPQQQIIHLLDAARSVCDVTALSEACLGTMADREALISELLEWTGTPFRQGLVRVYIAVRLLRKWKRLGIDVDAHIFSFLAKSREKFRLHMANIYHVVVELVRSQTFSVGRYLQWLVARGAIEQYRQQQLQGASSEGGTSQSSAATSLPGDIGLLSQLPVSRLPQHLRNLRDTLLARAGLTLSEEDVTRAVKADLRQRLPGLFRTGIDGDNAMICHIDHNHLSWSVKSEIGQWLRRGVSEHYKDSSRFVADKSSASSVEISSLTPEEFFTVRNTLESFGDLSMLADVLSDAANSDNVLVLASAVDTVNRHFDCFSAIGALNDLFKSFFEAFARVKQSGLPIYDLVFSLVELGHRLPGEVNAVVVLRQELSRGDRKFTLAASSPVSEHMAETLNDANSLFNDDLEQFLSSGNSMDDNTLVMIFQKLSQQLELCDDQGKFSASTICRHLVQLRSFNPKHFDLLLIRWIEGLLKSSTRPKLSNILAPLVGVGCVTLPAFSAMVKKLMLSESTRSAIPHLAELHLDLLELFVPDSNRVSFTDLLSYRFRMAQEEFLSKHSDEALGIIQNTAAYLATQAAQPGFDSVRSSFDNYIIPLLRDLLIRHPESMTQRCIHSLLERYPLTVDVVRRTLNLLLGFHERPGENNSLSEAEQAINMADNCSLPFCQLKLQLLFNMEGGEEVKSGIVDIMFKVAVADVRAGQTHWLDLVALMSQDAVHQIRQRAEKGFFAVAQSDSALEGDSPVERSNLRETARVYLTIVDGLAYSIPELGIPSVAPLLVEKMNSLLQKLVLTQMNIRSLSENRSGTMADQVARSLSVCEENLIFWFTAMLRMITIHRAAFDAPALAPSASQRPNTLLDQSRLLITICCIALSRSPLSMVSRPQTGITPSPFTPSAQQSHAGNSLPTYALDVAASLVDTLPDDARQQCARFLRERCPPFLHVHNEPRLMYLLGPVPDFLNTTSSQPASAPSPATSGPTSSMTPSATPASGSSSIPPSTSASMMPTGSSEDPNSLVNRLRIQHRGRVIGPYPLRPWEMLEEAAPVAGVNDTAVDLAYFGARRVRD
ncbi:hypothetical protein VTN77DRAFT_9712 [Rasamsonia byssochlamydoides]|uniref:uncharacterized protein n=1 Tax=Rasamsonia byssochlamydoides TaxID=89139 RepID=UPI0037422879